MSKIIGNTTATPVAIPDWEQNNPRMADYIKNKPDFDGLSQRVENIDEKVGVESVADQISTAVDNVKAYTDTEIREWVGDKYVAAQIEDAVSAIPTTQVVHGDAAQLLYGIIETYILNINYDETIKFDTSEIVIDGDNTGDGNDTDDGNDTGGSSSILGQGMLGYMVLG